MPINPDGTLIAAITKNNADIEVWLLPPRKPHEETEYALVVDGRVITYVRESHLNAVETLYLAMRGTRHERVIPWQEPATGTLHPACVCEYAVGDSGRFLIRRVAHCIVHRDPQTQNAPTPGE